MIRHTSIAIIMFVGVHAVSTASAQSPSADQPVGNPTAMVERAIELINAGDLNTASKLIQDATLIKSDLGLLALGRGLLFKANRQDLQAINYLENYNLNAGGDYRGFAAVGDIFLRNRKYDLAKGALEKARDFAPIEEDDRAVKAEISAKLAQALVSLNQPREAIRELKEAQSASATDPNTQMLICNLAVHLKESELANEAADNAINGFNQMLRLNPFQRAVYQNLATCFQLLIDLAAVELSKNPNDAPAFLRAARLMRELGSLQRRIALIDARELVLQAMETGGQTTDSMLFAAEIEAELGGIEQARARIEEILNQDAENARALQLKQSLDSRGASSAFGR